MEEGVLKMHRTIRKADVTSEKLSKDIDTAQDEEVQYRGGRMEQSSGNTSFHLVETSDPADDDELPPVSLSQAFAAAGSYRMELKVCRKLSQDTFAVRKRRIMSDIDQSLGAENLKATIDRSKYFHPVLGLIF